MANLGASEWLIIGAAGAAFVGLLAFSVWAIIAIVRGTRKRTNMGITFSLRNACPSCGEPLPVVRAPKNLRQAMWGGWTCRKCGTETDKWGRPVAR